MLRQSWDPTPIGGRFELVVHSATKYLNGHSDIVGVRVRGRRPDLPCDRAAGFSPEAVGAGAGPFDSSWLCAV